MNDLGKGFLWGVSTSGHQIEGNNVFSDWYEWERKGNILDGQTSKTACDSWNRTERDIQALRELGVNSYSFSIEWARVEPRQHRFDSRVLETYRSLTEQLLRERILPIVTLHSFVNPKWFSDLGGWEKEDCLGYFRRYVEKVVDSIGDLVKMWITISEPNTYVEKSYIEGKWPPGIQDRRRACKAAKHLVLAHSQAYKTIKGRFPKAMVGLTQGIIDYCPSRRSNPLDRLAARSALSSRNYALLDALSSGILRPPLGSGEKRQEIKGSIDYVGVSYRGSEFVKHGPAGSRVVSCSSEKTSGDLLTYARSLRRIIKETEKRYGLPIMFITEGNQAGEALEGEHYIDTVVDSLNEASRTGATIAGYLYRPLMDCFYWEHGYSMRIGLFETDFETLELRPRNTAQKLREIIRKHNRHYLLSTE